MESLTHFSFLSHHFLLNPHNLLLSLSDKFKNWVTGSLSYFSSKGQSQDSNFMCVYFFFNWSMVDSQCFNCIAKNFSFISKDSHCSRVKSKVLVIWQKPTLSSLHLDHFSVVSDSLWPHGLKHTRLPCPLPSLELAQTHIHWFGDAIQPSRPLWSPSPPTFYLSHHQGLFQ